MNTDTATTEFKLGDKVYAYRGESSAYTIYISKGHNNGAICVAPYHIERFERGLTFDTAYFEFVSHKPENLTLNIVPISNCRIEGTQLIVGEPEGKVELRWSREGQFKSDELTFPAGSYATLSSSPVKTVTFHKV